MPNKTDFPFRDDGEDEQPIPSPIYQRPAVMDAIIAALRPQVEPGQILIWREGLRWCTDSGPMAGHLERMDLPELCERFGYAVVHDFHHVAVVTPPGQPGASS